MADFDGKALGASDPSMQGMIDKCRQDAENRTGVAAGTWNVVRADATVWRNGALGLAKPGEVYTQALVPGYTVTLRNGATELTYHTDADSAVRLAARTTAVDGPAPDTGREGL